MKKRITEAFKSDDLCDLNLSPIRQDALIDFISVLPDVSGKVITSENCKSGFIKNGAIYEESLHYLSFNCVYATMKQNSTSERYINTRKKFLT